MTQKPIGVFDSGYGGLTILEELKKKLPNYDFLYLGDNARTPYGTRSFDVVFEFTLQAVEYLFSQGCDLVILACNTASAKALRRIQEDVLPAKYPTKRVLGVIRPTTEIIGEISKNKIIAVLATEGTVKSQSYVIEIAKFFPEAKVIQRACPMWVPLIENNLHNTEGGKWFVKRDIEELMYENQSIDTILLACTHYPLLLAIIESIVPSYVKLIPQGQIVAKSLVNYLKRHPEFDATISKKGQLIFLTTENSGSFDEKANQFFSGEVKSKTIKLT
jgi:glutamate racemase